MTDDALFAKLRQLAALLSELDVEGVTLGNYPPLPIPEDEWIWESFDFNDLGDRLDSVCRGFRFGFGPDDWRAWKDIDTWTIVPGEIEKMSAREITYRAYSWASYERVYPGAQQSALERGFLVPMVRRAAELVALEDAREAGLGKSSASA